MRVFILTVLLLGVASFAFAGESGWKKCDIDRITNITEVTEVNEFITNIETKYKTPVLLSIDNLINTPVEWLEVRLKPSWDMQNTWTKSRGFGGEAGLVIHWKIGK
jgi:hypothetical protein